MAKRSSIPYAERSDLELVADANGGDQQAMETLYLRYRDWVLGGAMRLCGDRDDALDVLQEVFAYLFGKFPGFELRAQMKTFLYPAVRNLSLDKVRKRGRTVPLDETIAEPAAPAAPAAAGPAAGRARLAEMVAGLPPEQSEIILLRFADELRLQEISQALDVPLGTVKSRLRHALERLRRRWGDKNPQND